MSESVQTTETIHRYRMTCRYLEPGCDSDNPPRHDFEVYVFLCAAIAANTGALPRASVFDFREDGASHFEITWQQEIPLHPGYVRNWRLLATHLLPDLLECFVEPGLVLELGDPECVQRGAA